MLLFWFLGVRPRIRRQAGNEFIPPECGFEEFESLVNWYKFNVFRKFRKFSSDSYSANAEICFHGYLYRFGFG